MAKTRSPNYPSIDLGAALAAVEPAFRAENRNRMAKLTLAKHMGYKSLNGRSLGKIGAVRAYGLIEGSGDDIRVSEDAIAALMAPPGAPQRRDALLRLALKPSLYKEIQGEFPTPPSEANLSYWLVRNGYTADASGKAARAYLDTMRLVIDPNAPYNPAPSEDEAEEDEMEAAEDVVVAPPTGRTPFRNQLAPEPPTGSRRAVFTLDEGDVTLTFPADLTADGYQELADYLEIFLRKAQRSAQKQAGTPFETIERSIEGAQGRRRFEEGEN